MVRPFLWEGANEQKDSAPEAFLSCVLTFGPYTLTPSGALLGGSASIICWGSKPLFGHHAARIQDFESSGLV